MPVISPLDGAYPEPCDKKATSSCLSASNIVWLLAAKARNTCAPEVCRKLPAMPFSSAVTAFSIAAMFVDCSAFSLAKAAASFSLSALASDMVLFAALRSLCALFRSAFAWANLPSAASMLEPTSGPLASAAAMLAWRSPPPVLQWQRNFSYNSFSFSPSSSTFFCIDCNIVTTLRMGFCAPRSTALLTEETAQAPHAKEAMAVAARRTILAKRGYAASEDCGKQGP
mmetsp:Transcript_15009/g.34547  ORF Transcript_15009/g.34547 Transcript_15009/m.34547 type:complete len:227 (+) Transcript_15009:658-1338(+)